MQNIWTVSNAFYDSFLKRKLNCDKENILILNTCSFQKKVLSNLTHSFPMHPFSTPWKHQKTLRCFQEVEKGCIGNEWVKKMCSDLLIGKMFLKMVLKTAVFWRFCKTSGNLLKLAEFTVKKVTLFSAATFLNKAIRHYNFLKTYKIFKITVQIWTVKCDFNKGYQVSIIQILF